MTVDIVPNWQRIARQTDEWRRDPRDGAWRLKQYARDTLRKRWVREKMALDELLQPYEVTDSGLSDFGSYCDRMYTKQVFNFDPEIVFTEPQALYILDKERRSTLLVELGNRGIHYFDEVSGISLPSYGIDAVFTFPGRSGWREYKTVAHERLHQCGRFMAVPDMYHYGFVQGYLSFGHASQEVRGQVVEEGMAVYMSFEMLMSPWYRQERRADFVQMKQDIGALGEQPTPHTPEYDAWYQCYLQKVYGHGSPYYWAGKIVGDFIVTAGVEHRVDQKDLMGLLMVARVEGAYRRKLVDAAGMVSGSADFARRWFGARLGKGEKDLEELKSLHEMVAVS